MSTPHLRDAAPKRREGDAQAAILEYLKTVPGFFYRNNSRVITMPGRGGRPRPVRFGGVVGSSDILGVLWLGKWPGVPVAIEVKREDEEPEPDQRIFLAAYQRFGIGMVARCVADVVKVFDEARGLA